MTGQFKGLFIVSTLGCAINFQHHLALIPARQKAFHLGEEDLLPKDVGLAICEPKNIKESDDF